jgi:hypothetical protein
LPEPLLRMPAAEPWRMRERANRRASPVCAGFFALLLAGLAGVVGCAGSPSMQRSPAALPAAVELSATPFFPQTAHQCGPAALATVRGGGGRPADPAALVTEVYLPGREGSLQAELVAAARARSLLVVETGPTLEDLLGEVAAGRPVLVLQRLGMGPWPNWHYAVLIGYDRTRERVLLRSGTQPRLEQRAALFEATWAGGGRWGVVLLEPGELPARPELSRYMRAAADLERQAPSAAEAAYRAAMRHWPDAPLPAVGLGNLAAVRGDWREAERWFRAALAVDATNAAALNNRAEALWHLGCGASARRALQDGLAQVAVDDPLRPVLADTARSLEASNGRADADSCGEFTLR